MGELLDQYHHRASLTDGAGAMVLEPSQVLENIALAMERVDTDINTPISIEEDVASFDELGGMTQQLAMGPALAVHVCNTALRILSARYPADLVQTPLPPEYDLRAIYPLDVTDREHDIAKTLFNRRSTLDRLLTDEDVELDLAPLDANGHLQVFVILFYIYGSKLGALKHRTGIT